MQTVLSVKDAIKRFGSTTALDGTDLELARGQWLGLLGPNGAGKTTLVRAIAGRVKLDGGEITLFGASLQGDSNEADKARQKLGIVPQEIAIYPKLTARENLHAFGKLNGIAEDDLKERIEWSLEWTGLADRANEQTQTYSGGMKRRLNIACSILHKPEILLLDEPSVGVDPQSRQRIWEMLDQLKQDGTSILLTTHGLEEAQLVCDSIVIIDHGKVIASGTFTELLQKTIGTKRKILIHASLDEQQRKALDSIKDIQLSEDGTIECHAQDIASDLHNLLDQLRKEGIGIDDLHVQSPSLQEVFIHLTGRELRE
ncbi:MAG: ABC transporter ATP-binding protein [Planctomycetota bacterium]|nr:ABC transporter ATP-binding protein [Planctomycetota bacterium]